ncbi:MAG: Lsr2 family protein [Mycobacteriales bacterium]
MAQKVQVLLVCDLHEDEVEGVETLAFGLDGSSYELDACAEHAGEMRDAFARYVGSARRAGRSAVGSGARRSSRGSSRPAASGSDRERVQAIREWARQNGHQVSERGRLSSALIAAYDAAH